MKKITALFLMLPFWMQAQCPEITLVSESDSYFSCTETLQPITPIVFALTNPNYTLTNFAPGITASFDGTLLTLSGTLPYPGYWSYDLSIPGIPDCHVSGGIGGGLSRVLTIECVETTPNSVTFSLSSELAVDDDGILYLQWAYGNTLQTLTYFLPAETTYTISDVPAGTDVAISAVIENSLPYCFPVPIASIVCTTTSLATSDFDKPEVGFSPNPVRDFIELSAETTVESVSFFDVTGRQVKHQSVGAKNQKIDLSDCAAGTYLMRVESQDQISAYKIIKQ